MTDLSCVCPDALDRCDRCDVLLGFPGLHLVAVTQTPSGLMLEVESCDPATGCPGCGVIATGHGRVAVEMIDAPGPAGRHGSDGASAAGSATRTPARWSRLSSRTRRSARPGAC